MDTPQNPESAPIIDTQESRAQIAAYWTSICEAAALLAPLTVHRGPSEIAQLGDDVVAFENVSIRAIRRAETQVQDMAIMLQTGIAALLAAHRSGADVSSPASILWDEFQHARGALFTLLRI